jgi:transcriptional regulator with XRE-family HTH domain
MKNKDFDKKVGDYLKKYRVEHGLTQEQMGASIGRTRLWYREIERGRNSLLFADAKKLCEALNIDLNEMIKELD